MNGLAGKRVRALLATARVANVPSVVSNVWVGAVVASVIGRDGEGVVPIHDGIAEVCWLAAAGVCLYGAGNFLNDWYDREWDAAHRPERALPSRLFSPGTYRTVAAGLLVMAALCAWAVSLAALAVAGMIGVCIAIYTRTHKHTVWGVAWVGLCRAWLVILGGAAVLSHSADLSDVASLVSMLWSPALALFFYIVALSVSARYESIPRRPGWVCGVSISLLAVPVCVAMQPLSLSSPCIYRTMGVIPYLTWMWVCLTSRRDTPRYVARLLAGIPWVDAMRLIPVAMLMGQQSMAVSHAVWTIPFVAFLMSLWWQRIAPAS